MFRLYAGRVSITTPCSSTLEFGETNFFSNPNSERPDSQILGATTFVEGVVKRRMSSGFMWS